MQNLNDPCPTGKEEDRFRRENMDCSGSYITSKHFSTQQTNAGAMLSVLKKSSNLMTKIKRVIRKEAVEKKGEAFCGNHAIS